MLLAGGCKDERDLYTALLRVVDFAGTGPSFSQYETLW